MKKLLRPKYSIPVFSIILIVGIFFSGAYSNWLAPATENFYQKLKVFNNILQTIQHVYVEETDPNELINNAIRGMVKNLDPHTTYKTAKEIEEWSKTYQGYSGIGISFDIIDNKITIMSIMEGGPSYKLGLMPGDRIIKINGNSAIGIKRNDVPKKLMGPPGTTVNITVEREGWETPKEYKVVREKIHVESIPTALFLEDKLGYIKIRRFSSTTGPELEESLNKLESKGMKRLILDLRGNSGGYLQMAVEVSEKFIPSDKIIVKTKGRIPAAYREYHSSNSGKHRMYPLIVLIDHSSASASEIVSGAVQDWDRGLIVGQTSFGKGLVQTQKKFPDGSVLLITTAKYYTPSGRLIQRDYDEKSLEDYYKEAYNDSIRQEKLADLPKYKTFAGRTVYGGGGIKPDIFLKNVENQPSRNIIETYYNHRNSFYTYSEQIQQQHSEIENTTPLQFSENFVIEDNTVHAFFDYLTNKGFEGKLETFLKDRDDIKYLLKREIAYRLWGEEGQFYVNYQRDTVLKKAKGYFSNAREVLAMSTLTEQKN